MTQAKPRQRFSTRSKRLLGFSVFAAIASLLYLGSPLLWLGSSTLSILTGATRVQTFQIDPTGQSDSGPGYTYFDGRRIIKTGRELSRSDATVVERILTAPQNYQIGPLVGQLSSCLVTPGIAFRFWRGRESVDVLACYWCYHIVVVTHNAQGTKTRSFVTSFPVNELSGFVRKSFPDDPLLQQSLEHDELRRMGGG